MTHPTPSTDEEFQVHSRGYLPHWQMPGGMYFVTFRLADSLPVEVMRRYQEELDAAVATTRRRDGEVSVVEQRRLATRYRRRVERYLDRGEGIRFLSNPRVAEAVASALEHFGGIRYRLCAWCIMPNHVHVIFQPHEGEDLPRLLHSWKSFTAQVCNKRLGRRGAFWSREYYDHLIRNERELTACIEYVEQNPLKAGLVDWRWVRVLWPWEEDHAGKDASGTQSRAGKDASGTQGHAGKDASGTGEDGGGTGMHHEPP